MGLRPGPFLERALFALRAGCLTDNVFKGHAARAFFENVSFRPPGVVLFGPAARAIFGKGSFCPSGGGF